MAMRMRLAASILAPEAIGTLVVKVPACWSWIVRGPAILRPDADLRVPVRERAPVRGAAAHERRGADDVRGVRGAGAAGAAPGGRPLQGLGLLHDGLRAR